MYTKWWTAAIILLTKIYLSENNGHNNSFNPVLIIFSTDLLKCCKLRNFAPFSIFPQPRHPTGLQLLDCLVMPVIGVIKPTGWEFENYLKYASLCRHLIADRIVDMIEVINPHYWRSRRKSCILRAFRVTL